MKLIRISIFAALYANADEDVLEDGDELVESDPCWLHEKDSEEIQYENGCKGNRNFLYAGRFIMEDYICRADDAADWCGGPLGNDYKANRREFSNLLKQHSLKNFEHFPIEKLNTF